ncbi:YibE/F family protein [Gleimia sp. 6138-11-ORH1]|uniref:YibE/F family protein n=1 Tax=Gleimia sp. 6138-11-ORH1 TaxID=2973937 RepID=UPI0021672EBE|nr:YibE/F family protein [Gleimia sp. 6138-11-ORH1]MCS4485034.1 YibE/F family protein [Gleimia sp. 6138-11-ORH1]
MTHSHQHGAIDLPQQHLRRIRVILTALVVPLAVLTLIGMVWLWPSSENSPVGSIPPFSEGTTVTKAKVTSLDVDNCQLDSAGNPSTEQPTLPGYTTIPNSDRLVPSALCAQILEGPSNGLEVQLQVAPEKFSAISVGDTITVLRTETGGTQGVIHVFWDMERTSPLLILFGIYLILVVVVARLRGLAAIAGLTASILILVYFVMPALMEGKSALLVTLSGVSAMLFASVYFAHGISIRTTTALLGTFGGMALTVFLAFWQVDAVHLSGGSTEESRLIFGFLPEVSLQSLLICGIVIAALGALNDVTITQASTVWELHAANPLMGKTKLFSHAMRVGRDHIASTVYTLAFAYAGTALPALLLALMVNRPLLEIAVTAEIAEEIVRTLIASIGLIISIPLTTFIGALLVVFTQGHQKDPQPLASE